MFIHAESVIGQPLVNDNDLYAVIRMGNDFMGKGNYYEIRIPLKITKAGQASYQDVDVWPQVNNLDLEMQRLIDLKVKRNNSVQPTQYYKKRMRMVKPTRFWVIRISVR